MNYVDLIQACERTWSQIQKHNPDVPDVILVVGSGGRRAATLYGHFANDAWETKTNAFGAEIVTDDGEESIHEVLLVAEQLMREPKEIFRTLLHESGHGIATTRGIKDVSGRRHNKRFAAICREIGLLPPEVPDSKLGFSAATLLPETEELYSECIADIEASLSVVRKLRKKDQAPKTSWAAECSCNRKIRVGKKIVESGIPINCAGCSTEFVIQLDDE